MMVGNGKLLVLSETDKPNNKNIERTLVQPLENSGYSVHLATLEHYPEAIQQSSPNVVFLVLSINEASKEANAEANVKTASDFSGLLDYIHKKDNEMSVILIVLDSVINTHSKPTNVVPIKSSQVEALLAQGVDELVLASSSPELTLVIVERAMASVLNKKQLVKDNALLSEQRDELVQDQLAGLSVQMNMSPEAPAQLDSFHFNYLVKPSFILGGDSVNYFRLKDERIVFYFADVSGHGAAAAIVTAALMSLQQQFIEVCEEQKMRNPAEMLGWFNNALLLQGFDQHITMFLGILDELEDTLQYSNAAQFPGVILQTDAQTTFLEQRGLPLAMCPNKYEYSALKLSKSFTIVMFSDGVLEIMPRASLDEKEKTLLSLVQYGNREVETLVEYLGLDKEQTIPDDIAIFTIARKV